MSRATYGTVELMLDKKKYVMKPTLKAYERIETRMGSLRQAIEHCSNMNIATAALIVSAGSGLGTRQEEEIKEAIFKEGTLNVLPAVTEFLMKLLNPSGKNLEDEETEKDDGEGEA